MNSVPRLLGCRGCGSIIVECAFALAGLPLEVEEVDYEVGSPTRDRLLSVNPLGQVPALVLPDSRVLTETLAIMHYVQDESARAELIPPSGDARRVDFYRWVVFLIAAVYPTFTYGDDTRKWAGDAGATALRESTDRHRKTLYLQLDGVTQTPFFLGDRLTAIDLYLAAMVNWRPRNAWFDEHTPKIAASARRTSALPQLQAIFARHFLPNA